MKGRFTDLTGQAFGRLQAIRRAECPLHFVSDKYRDLVWWECECECGTKSVVRPAKSLREGKTRSCGCLWRETGHKVAEYRAAMLPTLPNRRDEIVSLILSGMTNNGIKNALQLGHDRIAAVRAELNYPVDGWWMPHAVG